MLIGLPAPLKRQPPQMSLAVQTLLGTLRRHSQRPSLGDSQPSPASQSDSYQHEGSGSEAEEEEPSPAETKAPSPAEEEKPSPAEEEEPSPAETEAPSPKEEEEPSPAETEAPSPPEEEEPSPAETEAPSPPEEEEPMFSVEEEEDEEEEEEEAPRSEHCRACGHEPGTGAPSFKGRYAMAHALFHFRLGRGRSLSQWLDLCFERLAKPPLAPPSAAPATFDEPCPEEPSQPETEERSPAETEEAGDKLESSSAMPAPYPNLARLLGRRQAPQPSGPEDGGPPLTSHYVTPAKRLKVGEEGAEPQDEEWAEDEAGGGAFAGPDLADLHSDPEDTRALPDDMFLAWFPRRVRSLTDDEGTRYRELNGLPEGAPIPLSDRQKAKKKLDQQKSRAAKREAAEVALGRPMMKRGKGKGWRKMV